MKQQINPKDSAEIIGVFSHELKVDIGNSKKNNFNQNKQKKINEYYDLTGFPNLEITSLKILETAKIAMTSAALKAKVNIKFSGYDQTCSVGRNLALPGSDLDGWFIVIDGNDDSKQIFYQELINTLNPQIIDPDSISEIQIVLFSEIIQLGNEDNFEKNKRIQNIAQTTDILRNGWCILNNLSIEEKNEINKLKLAQKNHFMKENVQGNNIKFKLQRRIKLSQKFKELSQEEQYLIIQIIQDTNKGEIFDFRNNSENLNFNTLWLLHSKNIFDYYEKSKNFTAPWLTHKKLKDDIKLTYNKLKDEIGKLIF